MPTCVSVNVGANVKDKCAPKPKPKSTVECQPKLPSFSVEKNCECPC